MNKPHHALTFIFLVAILYTLLSIIVPTGSFRVADVLIRIPNPFDMLSFREIERIIDRVDSIHHSNKNSDALSHNTDSILATSDSIKNERIELLNTSPKSSGKIHALPIEMPKGIKPFGAFISALHNLDDENHSVVRVLHYGDSQIEGDRITHQVRTALQRKFGGRGLGLIPIWNTQYLPSGLRVHFSEHVKVNSMVNSKPIQKAGCVLGSIAEVAPSDSYREVVSIGVNSKQIFNTLSIISGSSYSSYAFKIIVDGTDTIEKHVMPDSKVNLVLVNLPSHFKRITILVRNPSTVKLYGLLAESGNGVSISNIALRGTSGNFFTQFDFEVASEIYRILNVRLVIMQFGINVVTANLASYAYYQKLMEQQIRAVKRFAPQTNILVVGVTDMANRIDGELQTIPDVEKVLNAQRKAALSNGVFFWDGFAAMGGKGSIIEWANSKPPLATKDYTHFTSYGAKRFGQKLANSLLLTLGNINLSNISQSAVSPDSTNYE